VLGLVGGLLVRRRGARARGAGAPTARLQERELASLRRIASDLARAGDVEAVVRTLLDEIASLFDVGFVALTFVSEDGREASGFLARAHGEDVGWWRDMRVDLHSEASGIASVVFEATAFAVYDVAGSTRVSARLADAVGAKSAAYIPLISEERVIAVISVATTDDYHAFSTDDLAAMQALASEATIALERTRSRRTRARASARGDRAAAAHGTGPPRSADRDRRADGARSRREPLHRRAVRLARHRVGRRSRHRSRDRDADRRPRRDRRLTRCVAPAVPAVDAE
jgi:GAF domain-containing protein